MKKLTIYLLLLAPLLTACLDDELVAERSSSTDESSTIVETGDSLYVNITINLPVTGTSTRASDDGTGGTSNDNFDDGGASEYAVYNAALLFWGAAASGETDPEQLYLVKAVDMNLSWNTDLDADHVTSYANKLYRMDTDYFETAVSTGETYKYIFVQAVANRGALFTIASDGSVTISGSSVSTFADYQQAISSDNSGSAEPFTSKGLYMTNAVLVNKKGTEGGVGSGNTITTRQRVPLTFYATYSAAVAATPTEIFIERGVAKVQVEDATSSASFSVNSIAGDLTLGVTLDSWALANANNKSYLARYIPTDKADTYWTLKSSGSTSSLDVNPYRCVGYNQINSDDCVAASTGYYRTYWGEDPNYEALIDYDGQVPTTIGNTLGDYVYCYENTFTPTYQKINGTTCVIVEATLSFDDEESDLATEFYTLEGNPRVLYDLESVENYILNVISKKLNEDIPEGTVYITLSTGASDDVQVEGLVVGDNGNAEMSGGIASFDYILDELNAILAAEGGIQRYVGGKTYYLLPIKHFGDDLTPWNDSELTSSIMMNSNDPYFLEECYDCSDDNYLGRYSVLRNNWYRLKISGVDTIGTATIPDTSSDTTWDDLLQTYIAFDVEVVDWATHRQTVVIDLTSDDITDTFNLLIDETFDGTYDYDME